MLLSPSHHLIVESGLALLNVHVHQFFCLLALLKLGGHNRIHVDLLVSLDDLPSSFLVFLTLYRLNHGLLLELNGSQLLRRLGCLLDLPGFDLMILLLRHRCFHLS